MRVLIFGANGMLGHKLCQILSPVYDTYGTVRYANGFDGYIAGVEAENYPTCCKVIMDIKPHTVINCIGITDKKFCEQEQIYTHIVNSAFPHALYHACHRLGARLIHISTDCVFSGEKGNYSEDDIPDPVDKYGISKRNGEVIEDDALTIRTSFIGKELSKQRGLLEWFLMHEGGAVSGYSKAIFTGFPTVTLAKIFRDIIIPGELNGLYHVASEPIAKYKLLKMINEAMGLDIKVKKYRSFHCDRSLDGSRFIRDTGFSPAPWPAMISEMVEDINSLVRVK